MGTCVRRVREGDGFFSHLHSKLMLFTAAPRSSFPLKDDIAATLGNKPYANLALRQKTVRSVERKNKVRHVYQKNKGFVRIMRSHGVHKKSTRVQKSIKVDPIILLK